MTKLTPRYHYQNERNLKRLSKVIDQYKLKRIQVAYLLNVSRSLVSRWYNDEKCCPDNAPDLLSAIMMIRDASSVRDELERAKVNRRS